MSDHYIVEASGARRPVTLTQPFAQGATGTIHRLAGESNVVAKLYKTPKGIGEYRQKIAAMLAAPVPLGPFQYYGRTYVQVAWPTATINWQNGEFRGYIMPEIDLTTTTDLENILQKSRRRQKNLPEFYGGRVLLAANTAALLAEFHLRGHHMVDMKPANIRFYPHQWYAAILDTDGFSINGARRFPAHHFSDEYIAPEARGEKPESLGLEQDLFALGVIIFRLMNNGIHPFQGIDVGNSSHPTTLQERIFAGRYAYGLTARRDLLPARASIHNYLERETRELFDRAFAASGARPTAAEWHDHIKKLIAKNILVRCAVNSKDHAHFSMGCGHCALERNRGNLRGGATYPTRQTPQSAGNILTTLPTARYPSGTQMPNFRPNFKHPSVAFAILFILVLPLLILGIVSGNPAKNTQSKPSLPSMTTVAITADRPASENANARPALDPEPTNTTNTTNLPAKSADLTGKLASVANNEITIQDGDKFRFFSVSRDTQIYADTVRRSSLADISSLIGGDVTVHSEVVSDAETALPLHALRVYATSPTKPGITGPVSPVQRTALETPATTFQKPPGPAAIASASAVTGTLVSFTGNEILVRDARKLWVLRADEYTELYTDGVRQSGAADNRRFLNSTVTVQSDVPSLEHAAVPIHATRIFLGVVNSTVPLPSTSGTESLASSANPEPSLALPNSSKPVAPTGAFHAVTGTLASVGDGRIAVNDQSRLRYFLVDKDTEIYTNGVRENELTKVRSIPPGNEVIVYVDGPSILISDTPAHAARVYVSRQGPAPGSSTKISAIPSPAPFPNSAAPPASAPALPQWATVSPPVPPEVRYLTPKTGQARIHVPLKGNKSTHVSNRTDEQHNEPTQSPSTTSEAPVPAPSSRTTAEPKQSYDPREELKRAWLR
jgi:hypothetical protein